MKINKIIIAGLLFLLVLSGGARAQDGSSSGAGGDAGFIKSAFLTAEIKWKIFFSFFNHNTVLRREYFDEKDGSPKTESVNMYAARNVVSDIKDMQDRLKIFDKRLHNMAGAENYLSAGRAVSSELSGYLDKIYHPRNSECLAITLESFPSDDYWQKSEGIRQVADLPEYLKKTKQNLDDIDKFLKSDPLADMGLSNEKIAAQKEKIYNLYAQAEEKYDKKDFESAAKIAWSDIDSGSHPGEFLSVLEQIYDIKIMMAYLHSGFGEPLARSIGETVKMVEKGDYRSALIIAHSLRGGES